MAIKISGNTVIDDSQNISVSGNATANSFVGDGSNLSNLPGGGNVTEATASGTLSDGSTVIVNADGTVSVVGQTEATGPGVGSEVVFESAHTVNISTVYDSTNQKVVIAYKDRGNSNYGTAIVGTVSGTSISFGSPVVFESANSTNISATYDSTNQKVVIAYSDAGNGYYGTSVVGTVSGTSISFGSPVIFASSYSGDISATYDSSTGKVVIAYGNYDNSNYGTAVVGTVSGTSISFGTPVVFNSGASFSIASAFDSTNGKIVIVYQDNGNSAYATAIVGTVSGTSISFGSSAVFGSSRANYIKSTFDSTNNKIVISYQDAGNNYYGTVVSGTVSGNSISFGTPVVFNRGNTQPPDVTFDSSNGKAVIAYQDNANSNYGTAIVFGNTGFPISQVGSVSSFNNSTDHIAATYDSSNGKIVIAYKDTGDSNYGKAIVGTVSPATPDAFPNNGRTWSDATQTNFLASTFPNAFDEDATSYAETTATGAIGSITFDPPLPISSITTFKVSASSNGSNSQNWGFNGGSMTSRVCNGITDLSDLLPSSGNLTSFEVQKTGSGVAVINEIEINSERLVDRKGGPSISFGTAVTFESGGAGANFNQITYDSYSNKVVIVYSLANNFYGYGIVGTVSGTSISFGSATAFTNYFYNPQTLVFDSSNNKVVVFGKDESTNNGTCYVGTVSGTSISFGSKVTFKSGNIYQIAGTFDSSNNKVVVAYQDSTNSNYGTAVVGTVSGTSISFGTPVVYNGSSSSTQAITFDSNNNKVVVVYKDQGNSNYGTAIVGTVSGTSISFGSEVVFESADIMWDSSAVYDSDAQKVIIAYNNSSNSNYGTMISGSVSGTSISFESATLFEAPGSSISNGAARGLSFAYDSSNKKSVLAFKQNRYSPTKGSAVVHSPTTISNNLTSENYIGISDGAFTDGQTATIQLIGSVDDAQSGLTPGQKYYVQVDGTLSETADTPSVFAGTAVSSTSLVVKS